MVVRPEDVRYLCFSGGGIRGISYAYALDELEKLLRFDFGRIRGVVGTSAGALYAAAIAARMSTQEMLRIAKSTDIQNLCTIDYMMNAHLLFTKWGLATQDQLIAYIDSFLGDNMITLSDLYQRTGKLLIVCVTNLNTNCAEYWSHESHPEMPVARRLLRAWLYRPSSLRPLDGCTFVDGGLVDNFPCHIFPQQHTLCFRVKWGSLKQHQIDGVQKYFSRITYAMLTGLERAKFERMDAASHTITIDCGDTATFTWQVEPATRSLLQSCGRAAVRNFVLQHDLHALGVSKKKTECPEEKTSDHCSNGGEQNTGNKRTCAAHPTCECAN